MQGKNEAAIRRLYINVGGIAGVWGNTISRTGVCKGAENKLISNKYYFFPLVLIYVVFVVVGFLIYIFLI